MTVFKRLLARMAVVFGVIGPAIIAGTANNDAGGISTYSLAGSQFGYLLLWVLFFNFFVLAVTQEIGIRLGIYTGKGLAALIRENFGVRWTLLAIVVLFTANLAVTTSEFAGIASALELFGLPRILTVPLFAVLIFLILYKGSFKKIERFFLFISLFFLVYIVSAVMAHPGWLEVARATVRPTFDFDPAYFMVMLGIMGTTITPWGQFFIQAYVVDKGINPRHYKIEKMEVFFSAFFTCLIAAMIIITTKNVLYDHGILVDGAEKAALSLRPILGSFAQIIFGVGFFCASLLGAFILPLSTSYTICEAFGFESGINTTWKQAPWFYGSMLASILFGAAVVLLSYIPLFKIMIFAQVVNAMLLPVILVFLVLLLKNRQRLGLPLGSRWGSWAYNIIAWLSIAVLTIVSLLLLVITLFPDLAHKFV